MKVGIYFGVGWKIRGEGIPMLLGGEVYYTMLFEASYFCCFVCTF